MLLEALTGVAIIFCLMVQRAFHFPLLQLFLLWLIAHFLPALVLYTAIFRLGGVGRPPKMRTKEFKSMKLLPRVILLALLAFPSMSRAEVTGLVKVESCGEHPKISSSKTSGSLSLSGTVIPDDTTDCILRFTRLRDNPPRCVVTWGDSLPHMHYRVTKEYIQILQTQ